MVALALVEWSYVLAIIVDVGLFAVLMLGRKRVDGKTYWRGAFSEDDLYPSLGRLQLLVWTFVVVFVFLTVSAVRIFSGVPSSANIPTNILTLLGINASSTVISYGVSSPKYRLKAKAPDKEPQPLSTMLQENGQFSITRFQMFSWTIVALLIFLSTFFVLMANLPSDLTKLDLPDVSSTLVALTGISQGAYLTGKGLSK